MVMSVVFSAMIRSYDFSSGGGATRTVFDGSDVEEEEAEVPG